MRRRLAAALLGLAACGGDSAGRAFELEIRGLSARASALVVKLRTEATACREVTLEGAPALAAEETQRWDRSSGADRTFAMSPVVTDSVTLIAYALDSAEAPLQVACRTVTYEKLGDLVGGRLVLVLSRRVTAAQLDPR